MKSNQSTKANTGSSQYKITFRDKWDCLPSFIKRIFIICLVIVTLLLWYKIRILSFENIPIPSTESFERANRVTIHRDEWGIPHIHGKSDADAAFGLAYAHSEDDWDTIYKFILTSNAKSSLIKPSIDSIKNDYFALFLDIENKVKNQLPLLEPKAIELFEAYAEGINFYAYNNRKKLKHQFIPLNKEHIAAHYIFILAYLTGITDEISSIRNSKKSIQSSIANHKPNSFLPPIRAIGSNAFAVSPQRSEDRVARIFSNTHQPWEGPLSWYEAHMSSDEGWNMIGGVLAGSPVLFLGHNEKIAWTHTYNYADLVDSFKLVSNNKSALEYELDGETFKLKKRTASLSLNLGLFNISIPLKFYSSEFGPTLKLNDEFYSFKY